MTSIMFIRSKPITLVIDKETIHRSWLTLELTCGFPNKPQSRQSLPFDFFPRALFGILYRPCSVDPWRNARTGNGGFGGDTFEHWDQNQ